MSSFLSRVEIVDPPSGRADLQNCLRKNVNGCKWGQIFNVDNESSSHLVNNKDLTPNAPVTVKLQPSDAFGEYQPELIEVVPVTDLPEPLAIGMQFEGTANGNEEKRTYATVTDIADGKAVLDCNHPLAGMALVFTCQVMAVRQGTVEEIAAAQGKAE
jgi:hypothetical protein